MPVVITMDNFVTDTDADVQSVKDYAAGQGAETTLCQSGEKRSEGTI